MCWLFLRLPYCRIKPQQPAIPPPVKGGFTQFLLPHSTNRPSKSFGRGCGQGSKSKSNSLLRESIISGGVTQYRFLSVMASLLCVPVRAICFYNQLFLPVVSKSQTVAFSLFQRQPFPPFVLLFRLVSL